MSINRSELCSLHSIIGWLLVLYYTAASCFQIMQSNCSTYFSMLFLLYVETRSKKGNQVQNNSIPLVITHENTTSDILAFKVLKIHFMTMSHELILALLLLTLRGPVGLMDFFLPEKFFAIIST